jgi:hypothetical protein
MPSETETPTEPETPKDPPTPVSAKEPKDRPADTSAVPPVVKVEKPPIPEFKPAFFGSPIGMRAGKIELNFGGLFGMKKGK